MTLRLSHITQSPWRHLWRYSNFFCVACAIKSPTSLSASASSMPTIASMRTGLRNSALRPFSGCVRTSGCTPGGGNCARLSSLRPDSARAVFALIDVHGFQSVDLLLGGRGQIIIGVVHVDVLGVAAARRQIDREQRRRLGRPGMV